MATFRTADFMALRASPPTAMERRRRAAALATCAALAIGLASCSSSEWVQVRDTPKNPLGTSLKLVSRNGPKPTKRTKQLLRRFNLADGWSGDRRKLLKQLEELQQREPDREKAYALAEIAYVSAKEAEALPEMFRRGEAIEFYGTSLVHAYCYFFDYQDELPLNAYDPQFRGASDLYNQSLEGLLRLVQLDGALQPGTTHTIHTASQACSFKIVLHSTGWHEEDFDHVEFVSDYRVQGLRNHYHSYGLGVPLIAIRKSHDEEDPAEQFYPPKLSFPLTAFLRVLPSEQPNRGRAGSRSDIFSPPTMQNEAEVKFANGGAPQFVLELYDSLENPTIEVARRRVPLEADYSTPLAYFLNQPQFQDSKLSTDGLLNPGKVKSLQGLYMLEPYDPQKMPVLMVHGLWSSPVTWMEMFNDLRSDPKIRDHYQFWFYLYPSGQPFWLSGTQMREDLAMMRRQLDPQHQAPALDQMVLVGHSMGGLVSKMQTVGSGDAFWQTNSDQPFAELQAEDDVRRTLANAYFFDPSPSVRRVVTIGTPHRGSQFANSATRWLGNKLINIPASRLQGRRELLATNKGFFRPNAAIEIATSIDSLAPDSPILPVLLTAPPGPWISYYNVVGQAPDLGWRGWFTEEGDGVVSIESARLDDMPQLAEQIVVPSDHVNVHRHPQSILKVRHVLLEQIAELENFPSGQRATVAASTGEPLRRN